MYIRWFKDLTIKDIPSVGGKNASLGEMYSKLATKGVPVPNGFALTADAYWAFLAENKLDKKIKDTLKDLDKKDVHALSVAGAKVRQMILSSHFPKEVKNEIEQAYKKLCKLSKKPRVDVAVRSSATAEDLPDASFAGQQESYLNVCGEAELMTATKKCIASLFTDRAISYREDKGFDHMAIALSVGIQEMIHSDIGQSGVMFTLDTESGFKGVVLINAAYGLGEYVVKGRVTPDQYYVFKNGLKEGYKSIISRRLGSKEVKLVYEKNGGTKQEKVKMPDQKRYCLHDNEVLQLAKWGVIIEEHYNHPMDIEWAKDGGTGKLYIVQARSETVRSRENVNIIEQYSLKAKGKIILTGSSVGQKIGQGKARVINSPKQMKSFKPGEVLVTRITDPDWEPIMRIASAIITEQGGKTSHAAIVSRELGTPCIVGAVKARQVIKNGEEVTVSCSEGEVGYVYKGLLPFEVTKTEIKKLAKTRTKIMMNVGDPDSAFALSAFPNDGVGLAREEFIFMNFVKIHPMALVNYKNMKGDVKKKIDELTVGYKDKTKFCVDKLAEGFAFIASAFYPNDVIIRLSDFKTNEYASLIGGTDFEPKEENPMIGWRGASRYYDPKYKPGFKLECEAIKKVREEWGVKNVIVMVPFCRTVEEGKEVLKTMKEFGLERGKNGLQVYMMCEIPSNVILAKEFCEIFDGFSIGSNDLTQLTLGVDRDSALVSHVYDEKNAAVKTLIRQVIQIAHQYKKKVGICGQAPSDYPEFAEFLVQEGIDSISLNPDTVLKTRIRIAAMEHKVPVKAPTFRIAMASKLLLIFGVIGLMTALGGYTCQTVQNDLSGTSNYMKNELDAVRAKAKQDALKQMKETQVQQKTVYSEDSFVKFSLTYPANWLVSHGSDSIKFYSPDQKNWFTVAKGTAANIPDNQSTESSWQNYLVKSYMVSAKDDSAYKVLEVYPNSYKNTSIIALKGDSGNFDEIMASVTGFAINK